MNEYIYINDFQKRGTLGISNVVFEKIVTSNLANLSFLSLKKDDLRVNTRAVLHSPVKVSINREIVHIAVYIDVKKGENIQEISMLINNEIANNFVYSIDTIPFDVQVKVVRLL